jgi:hypothetical protein
MTTKATETTETGTEIVKGSDVRKMTAKQAAQAWKRDEADIKKAISDANAGTVTLAYNIGDTLRRVQDNMAWAMVMNGKSPMFPDFRAVIEATTPYKKTHAYGLIAMTTKLTLAQVRETGIVKGCVIGLSPFKPGDDKFDLLLEAAKSGDEKALRAKVRELCGLPPRQIPGPRGSAPVISALAGKAWTVTTVINSDGSVTGQVEVDDATQLRVTLLPLDGNGKRITAKVEFLAVADTDGDDRGDADNQ